MDFLAVVDCAGGQKINCCYARKIRKHISVIAQEVDHLSVLTGRIGKVTVPSNVTLKSYNWVRGKKIRIILKLNKILR